MALADPTTGVREPLPGAGGVPIVTTPPENLRVDPGFGTQPLPVGTASPSDTPPPVVTVMTPAVPLQTAIFDTTPWYTPPVSSPAPAPPVVVQQAPAAAAVAAMPAGAQQVVPPPFYGQSFPAAAGDAIAPFGGAPAPTPTPWGSLPGSLSFTVRTAPAFGGLFATHSDAGERLAGFDAGTPAYGFRAGLGGIGRVLAGLGLAGPGRLPRDLEHAAAGRTPLTP